MSGKQAGFSQSKVTESKAQESLEAAQRADIHNADKLAAAGHTNTGQTIREQVEELKEGADPQVREEVERVEGKHRNQILKGGAPT
ncbi:hypothetical protein D9Q98_003009 [Chlorella vulgaris]|uniref:Uncharacterized protein n=1 Tax=Chlorella vulgaris TaxID=3077 RepID=A0A9D4TVT0_CHLVU|nr:hypothetical protein D9Q98_003009 [Chlorella vulgaris]